jgi:hypothetical protein
MNKVEKTLLDIKMAEAKLEYVIYRNDEDETQLYLAGWTCEGQLLLYANALPRQLSVKEAWRFAEWILDMLEEQDETAR